MPYMKSRQRSRSLIAEPPRMPQHSELCDVAAEEERHGPVGHDSELPREERELVQVVRPRHEPADEPAQRQAEDEGDALVAPEGRYLAERSEPVRLRVPAQVLRETPRLAERVLRGGRVRVVGRLLVRNPGAVAERPQVLVA